MYDVCQKNDCCSIIYCLKNALGELIDSKKIKKKELVGEDIVNCLNKILYPIFDYPHEHYTFKHFEV